MAIDSADRNWIGRTPRVGLGACALLGLSALGGVSGCSKGGAPDLTGCAMLADLQPGDTVAPPMNTTYALLKTPSGATIPVSLDGGKGSYSGTHLFSQCNQQDTYTVSKVVLVDKNGNLVATATSPGGSTYTVTYPGGRTAPGLSFSSNVTTYTDSAAGPAVTLQGLTLSAATANQGDALTVQATMAGDPCGVRESQWWLTSNLTGTTMATAPQIIAGGSGSATVRVPPTAMPGQYYLAGQVTLSSGRILQIHQVSVSDPSYTVFDSNNKSYPTLMPKVPVVSVMVAAKADVDKTAPQVISIEATPLSGVRCGTVNLTLHLKDDQPLPAGQQVKVWLGKASSPKLFSTLVVGSEYLSGKVQIPIDAPSGVWYAWPEVIRDAAGNEARATFTPDGKFALNPAPADPMAQSIAAATFNVASNGVDLPDMAGPGPDLGMVIDMAGQPDMATPLPAVLTNISVMPGQPKPNEGITIYATWTDNTNSL